MFRQFVSTSALTTVLVVSPLTGALAQDEQARDPSSSAMAEECIIAMNNFAQRMYEDDFWVSGWGDSGYSPPPAPQSTGTGTMGSPDTPSAMRGDAEADSTSGIDPRERMAGIDAPRYQIRTLYNAGRVLAHRGDSDGCNYIVAKMDEVYGSYAQQLEEAGVDPSEVSSWRQEQLALAQPLSESDTLASYRIDTLTGTDVRNLNDELLGSVSDVIINPENGETTHLIVARGGFLGMGEDHYAIPWGEVRATPGLETFVVEMSEAEIENVPAVDRSRFSDPEAGVEDRERTDQFWTQRG